MDFKEKEIGKIGVYYLDLPFFALGQMEFTV